MDLPLRVLEPRTICAVLITRFIPLFLIFFQIVFYSSSVRPNFIEIVNVCLPICSNNHRGKVLRGQPLLKKALPVAEHDVLDVILFVASPIQNLRYPLVVSHRIDLVGRAVRSALPVGISADC